MSTDDTDAVPRVKRGFSRLISVIGGHLCHLCVKAVIPIAALGGTTHAQAIEARIDAIAKNPPAIHAGAGFTIPLGTYVRSGMDAAIGASENGISGRVDFVNRFHLDPFRQHKWAPYGGGGLTARFDDNRSSRVYLLLFAGVDGPPARGVGASIEAGFGGGGRLGIILRKTTKERR